MKQLATDKLTGEADFSFAESLYQKDDGSYVLVGSGGRFTKWNGKSGEKNLTEAQALRWLESHYNTAEIEPEVE